MQKLFLFIIASVLFFTNVTISNASGFDVYVDQSATESTEDGTQENPFKTISQAVTHAASNPADQRKIFISNGTYSEKVILNESMSLTGENKSATIINGQGLIRTVEINKTSTIYNLTVSKGYTGVYVSPGAGATIKSCKILKTEKMGIEIEKSSTSNSEKVTVTKSDISKGDGKGFYIKKRKISIEDNDVEDNKEEGIDLRAGVKGKIKKNTITKNGESGIELVVGSTDLKITGNKIKGNSASGIANQFYKESKKLGEIMIEKNKIQKNDNYGLKCDAPSGGNVPKNYWIKSIDFAKNIFSGNGRMFANRCKFPVAVK